MRPSGGFWIIPLSCHGDRAPQTSLEVAPCRSTLCLWNMKMTRELQKKTYTEKYWPDANRPIPHPMIQRLTWVVVVGWWLNFLVTWWPSHQDTPFYQSVGMQIFLWLFFCCLRLVQFLSCGKLDNPQLLHCTTDLRFYTVQQYCKMLSRHITQ